MISIVIGYYRQPDALDWQIQGLEKLSRFAFELIVVDDGSGDDFAAKRLEDSSLSGKLVTVLRDVSWNIPGARNWGMAIASNANCLRTDIDHRPTAATMAALVEAPPLKGQAWRFRRIDENHQPMKPHTDSYFLSRADYWSVGGYDERLSGAYGQNARDFFARAETKLSVRETPLVLETNPNLKSPGGSRNLIANRIRLRILSWEKPRRTLRLKQNVSVITF